LIEFNKRKAILIPINYNRDEDGPIEERKGGSLKAGGFGDG